MIKEIFREELKAKMDRGDDFSCSPCYTGHRRAPGSVAMVAKKRPKPCTRTSALTVLLNLRPDDERVGHHIPNTLVLA